MRISDWSSDVCSSDLVDDLIMFFKAERRALAGRPARHQRTGALFDLPVHKAREGGRIERPVAEWRHQGGNRPRNHVSLLYKDRAGPIEHGLGGALGNYEEPWAGKQGDRECKSRSVPQK